MTIKDIDVTSDYFQSGGQIRTSDGKLVTFKHVCVEEAKPVVPLVGVPIGGKFRLRNGRTLVLEASKYLSFGKFFGRELSPSRDGLFFEEDGTCRIGSGENDVVEILAPSLLKQIERQVIALNPADIDKVIISSSDWSRLMEEARETANYRGGLVFVDETRVFHSANVPTGDFSIRFKLR